MNKAASLNSLTNFGSCRGSDADSVVSFSTFRSVRSSSMRSGSVKFYSDDSDTDTTIGLEDDKESDISALSEFFFDVKPADPERHDDDAAISDSLISSLSRLHIFDSAPTTTDPLISSPRPSERELLLKSVESLVSLDAHHAEQPPPSALWKTDSLSKRKAEKSTNCQMRVKNWLAPFLFLAVFIVSLTFQFVLRIEANLSSVTLTFWRSVAQLIIGTAALLISCQSPLGTSGTRLKLSSFFMLNMVAVMSMLLSSGMLHAGDLAAIFLNVPIGALFFESVMRKESFRAHVVLLVMAVWISAILLLSGNIPWAIQASFENQTGNIVGEAISADAARGNENQSNRWPPIFGLDNVHMWPIQPIVYSGKGTLFSSVSNFWTGLVFGLLALAASSALPTVTSSCSWNLLWSLLTLQAVGGLCAALIVIFITDGSVILDTSNDWLMLSGIVALSIAGNGVSLLCLGLKEQAERLGSAFAVPAIPVGVVSRSALEIVVIFSANLLMHGSRTVSVEEGCGITLLVLTTTLCYLLRPAKVNTASSIDSLEHDESLTKPN